VRGRLPTVVTIHDLSVLHAPRDFRPWFRNYARVVIPRLARRAARVITVSETTRQDVIEHLGLPEEKVVAVPNGVALSHPPSVTRDGQPTSGPYQLPRWYVLSVGTLQPRKNLLRLFEAIAEGIGRVWGDDALAAELRVRGLARAPQFSWERTARLTADVYESVL